MNIDKKKIGVVQGEEHELESQSISAEFVESILRHFSQYIKFVISSGTFAYGGATKDKSDIDIVAIFTDDISELPHNNLLLRLRAFIEDYLRIHRKFDYCPDTTFPGEYITASNVEDALAGRGFHATPEHTLHLPTASNEYYLQDAERWYRAWRSALAFGKCLYGDTDKFIETKDRAWEVIILYILLRHPSTTVNSTTIFDTMIDPGNKWNGIGVTEKYVTFRQDERIFVERALVRLSTNGFLSPAADGTYVPSVRRIKEWEEVTAEKITDGSIKQAPFLLTMEETKELAHLTAVDY